MKRSPFINVFSTLDDAVAEIMARKIKKKFLDKKLHKEITNALNKIEARYKENEMNIHAPQELVGYMIKTMSREYSKKNPNPTFDFEKFATSKKAKFLIESFTNNNCYTNEEEIKILNMFGCLPGQNGKWHYSDETLEKIYSNRETDIGNLPEEKYSHEILKPVGIAELKDYIVQLSGYMCEYDKELYLRNADTLASQKFIEDCNENNQNIYSRILKTLENSLSEDEKIEMMKHVESLQFEVDERGNKKMRSILTVPLTEARKFSYLASCYLNASEGKTEVYKFISDLNRKYNGAIKEMSPKKLVKFFDDVLSGRTICENGDFLNNMELVQELQNKNSIKIEYEAKLDDLEDVKKFGKEQFQTIFKDLDPKKPNYKDAYDRIINLTKTGVYKLFPEEMKALNKALLERKSEKNEDFKNLTLIVSTYSSLKNEKSYIEDPSKIPSHTLNEIISKTRDICEKSTLTKRGIVSEKETPSREKTVEVSSRTYDKLEEIRNQLIIDKTNRIQALEKEGRTTTSQVSINTISREYDNQINAVDKFLAATIIETDLNAKEAHALIAADLKENAENIENIIKHASTEELKNIMDCVEEANNLGICEDTCNFITEEIKNYRSEDITYTDDGKFVVEERTQEDVLERTITEGN